MIIRRAKEQDAAVLAELIFNSAPLLLTAAFEVEAGFTANNFLTQSLSNKEGQYGYHNHWVAEQDNKVIACVSAWHTHMSDEFHSATLAGVARFYGLQHALSVLQTNQVLQDCLPQLKDDEWGVGHLSVAKSKQRQGVASALITYMEQLAIENNKSVMCLDVEQNNHKAVSFYSRLGFSVEYTTAVTPRMKSLGIDGHLHLSKVLDV